MPKSITELAKHPANQPPSSPDREVHLSRPELARRWGLSPSTLGNWASAGKGPDYLRLAGGKTVYRMSAIVEFEAQSLVTK